MVKNGPLVKIEGALEAEVARLLRGIDGIEVVVGEPRARRADFTVRFAGVARPIDIEVKQYLNAATAWQLVRHAEAAGDHYLLVVTDQATNEARDILERHGVGVVDGAGNAHMELPGLLLHIEGRRRAKEARLQGAIRLSGKAGIVAQALLLERDRIWQIHDLAEEADVSDGLVHRVLARLKDEGLVATEAPARRGFGGWSTRPRCWTCGPRRTSTGPWSGRPPSGWRGLPRSWWWRSPSGSGKPTSPTP